jgi:regulator of replication initiation timing
MISSAAQMAVGENVTLRYENRLLWHRLQKKDTQKVQRSFIISCARVVTEKDIMEAQHAKNNVRVLAIEWPEELN